MSVVKSRASGPDAAGMYRDQRGIEGNYHPLQYEDPAAVACHPVANAGQKLGRAREAKITGGRGQPCAARVRRADEISKSTDVQEGSCHIAKGSNVLGLSALPGDHATLPVSM